MSTFRHILNSWGTMFDFCPAASRRPEPEPHFLRWTPQDAFEADAKALRGDAVRALRALEADEPRLRDVRLQWEREASRVAAERKRTVAAD